MTTADLRDKIEDLEMELETLRCNLEELERKEDAGENAECEVTDCPVCAMRRSTAA